MIAGLTNVTLLLRQTKDEYVGVASMFEDRLDVALVDGLYRDECILAALPKIRHGGLLILDNVNWFLPRRSRSPGSRRPGRVDSYPSIEWETIHKSLQSWRLIWTSSGVTDTAIWIRSDSSE